MWPNAQETTNLVTFTKEIHNGKIHFLCSDHSLTSWVPNANETFEKIIVSWPVSLNPYIILIFVNSKVYYSTESLYQLSSTSKKKRRLLKIYKAKPAQSSP